MAKIMSFRRAAMRYRRRTASLQMWQIIVTVTLFTGHVHTARIAPSNSTKPKRNVRYLAVRRRNAITAIPRTTSAITSRPIPPKPPIP